MVAPDRPRQRRPLRRAAPDSGLARSYFGAALGVALLAAGLAKLDGGAVPVVLQATLVPLELVAGGALLIGSAAWWPLMWAAADLGVSAAVLADEGSAALVPAALSLLATALVVTRFCLPALPAPRGRTETRERDAERPRFPNI